MDATRQKENLSEVSSIRKTNAICTIYKWILTIIKLQSRDTERLGKEEVSMEDGSSWEGMLE